MKSQLDRRRFLQGMGRTALGVTATSLVGPAIRMDAEEGTRFESAWPEDAERTWAGPEYWTNPLQDWRVRAGRLECIAAGEDRNTALLTHDVATRSGDLRLSVRLGRLDNAPLDRGFVGFRIGLKHQMGDYRAVAIYGRGMNAGVDAEGRLLIGKLESSAPMIDLTRTVDLEFRAGPAGSGYKAVLTAKASGKTATITREIPAEWLTGGLGLACCSAPVEETPAELKPIKDFDFYPPHQQSGGAMRFWFSGWNVAGSKIDTHTDRTFGPILFTMHTLTNNTLKLSAQLPPIGNASRKVTLQTQDGAGGWREAAVAELDPDAWNATFKVTSWDTTRDAPYRILYSMQDGRGLAKLHTYSGTVRKDPVAQHEITVGLLTCIWDFGFPHHDFTKNLAAHRPDLLLFTGDQIYEPVGGFGAVRSRQPARAVEAMQDFLRKWFIFGWAVGGLTREIPSVCMTDDHDMFHGNIWGCGGRPTNPAATAIYDIQDSGGYKMSPRWVNMVQRVQTSHLPDPFDPTPVEQGIGVYYTDLRCGGISFAILEDRKWKSAPREHLPGAEIVNGFALNPEWNAARQSDVPATDLFGPRQLDFLEHWATDWSGGAWMKFAVSQTPSGCLHTEPSGMLTDDDDPHVGIPQPGIYVEGDHMVADHDSGGWPQSGRNEAVRKWRKGFAAHLCGDQHLGTTAHYGVDQFRDSVYSICTPAISNIFPRRWFPPEPAPHALAGSRNIGDYLDAFGNRMTVLAVANPARYEGAGLDGLRFRVTGYTILRCDRLTRKTTISEWPRWVDPIAPGAKPYSGWPMTIDQIDNGLWGAEWELDPIVTSAAENPVVQVKHAGTGDVIYTLRIIGNAFTPGVREAGTYTVIAFDPDGKFRKEWPNVQARKRIV